MKVNLVGLCLNAASRLEALARPAISRNEEEGLMDSIFMLKELARHASETKRGHHSIDEFADFYCFKP